MNLVDLVNKNYMNKNIEQFDAFKAGDTVNVSVPMVSEEPLINDINSVTIFFICSDWAYISSEADADSSALAATC